ncbi:hypothetical protein B0H17DRAFT_1140706 [Mycena rosella]|uniref:Uncharacterized protein n=1 Tax=Mycena rosella TaxID=1033263 RepID=A0AAD7G9T1_MYCRO|nr:hypothetical protein B0H17DRAFT_1140706 [Mycena rosella]
MSALLSAFPANPSPSDRPGLSYNYISGNKIKIGQAVDPTARQGQWQNQCRGEQQDWGEYYKVPFAAKFGARDSSRWQSSIWGNWDGQLSRSHCRIDSVLYIQTNNSEFSNPRLDDRASAGDALGVLCFRDIEWVYACTTSTHFHAHKEEWTSASGCGAGMSGRRMAEVSLMDHQSSWALSVFGLGLGASAAREGSDGRGFSDGPPIKSGAIWLGTYFALAPDHHHPKVFSIMTPEWRQSAPKKYRHAKAQRRGMASASGCGWPHQTAESTVEPDCSQIALQHPDAQTSDTSHLAMAEQVLRKREQQPVHPPLPSRRKPKPAAMQPDAPIAPVQVTPKLKAPRMPTPMEPGAPVAPVEAPPKPKPPRAPTPVEPGTPVKAPRTPAPMQPDTLIVPVESDARAGLTTPISSVPVEKASLSNPCQEEAATIAGWQAYNGEVLPLPRCSLGAMLGLADDPQPQALFGPCVTADVVRTCATSRSPTSCFPASRSLLLEAVEVPTLADVYGASTSDPVTRTPKSPIHAAPQTPVLAAPPTATAAGACCPTGSAAPVTICGAWESGDESGQDDPNESIGLARALTIPPAHPRHDVGGTGWRHALPPQPYQPGVVLNKHGHFAIIPLGDKAATDNTGSTGRGSGSGDNSNSYSDVAKEEQRKTSYNKRFDRNLRTQEEDDAEDEAKFESALKPQAQKKGKGKARAQVAPTVSCKAAAQPPRKKKKKKVLAQLGQLKAGTTASTSFTSVRAPTSAPHDAKGEAGTEDSDGPVCPPSSYMRGVVPQELKDAVMAGRKDWEACMKQLATKFNRPLQAWYGREGEREKDKDTSLPEWNRFVRAEFERELENINIELRDDPEQQDKHFVPMVKWYEEALMSEVNHLKAQGKFGAPVQKVVHQLTNLASQAYNNLGLHVEMLGACVAVNSKNQPNPTKCQLAANINPNTKSVLNPKPFDTSV